MMTQMSESKGTIWVVNHAGHNIQSAVAQLNPRFVEYLTEGNQTLSEVDRLRYNMYQQFANGGEMGHTPFNCEEDYLLLCGNTVLNMVAAIILMVEMNVPFIRVLIWDGKRRFYHLKDLTRGGLHKLTQDDIANIQRRTIS